MAPTRACKGGKLPTGELLSLQPDLTRALSITGQTITLIKGVSVSSDGACQLSGKRGRAETLPGTCTFTEKGASSPDGQRVLLKQGAQGPAGRRRFVAWDVSQAVAAGTFKRDSMYHYSFDWLRGDSARICCVFACDDEEGPGESVAIYDASFKLLASSDQVPGQERMSMQITSAFTGSPDGKLLAGCVPSVSLLRASTCKERARFQDVGKDASFYWMPDSSGLLVAEASSKYGSECNPVQRLVLIDAEGKPQKVLSSAEPPSPLRAVIGWGKGQQGLVLLCAGEAAAGAENPCPLQLLTVQDGSWSSSGAFCGGTAVFVDYDGARAALSPSAKLLAVVNASSLFSAWSVQFLDISAGSVVAEWAAPAGSGLGWPAQSTWLEWAESGQRLMVKTSEASYLIELEISG